jgi:hypothetical protein
LYFLVRNFLFFVFNFKIIKQSFYIFHQLLTSFGLWLEIPEELHNRALNEFNDGHLNPLEELVQHHIYRVVKDYVEKQQLLEQSTNNPDIEALKEQISELERQIESLKSENESLKVRKSSYGRCAIFRHDNRMTNL